VHDMIRILGARYPLAKVKVLPVRVQGPEAPAEIAGAIRYADRHRLADVIITGRGGGSIEDLWAFNDKRVAQAIYDCETPVISAVGHEPDVTIADFVADRRASTPSNAAEICVPDRGELLEALENARSRITRVTEARIETARNALSSLAEKRVMRDPAEYIDEKRETLDRESAALAAAAEKTIGESRRAYVELVSKLDAMSPLKVLGRGYAIARKTDGTVVRERKDVKSGERLALRLKTDEIGCIVE
ncbi:MAG: exodeoxyribonuclease VII large subunit, partial [Oscillospiraceae bacterium]|nr:exodeoxyribonuclease VII large subunit [Oscillospiraceae bacterium]